MDVVFNALIISKVSYALPAWAGFLSANLLNIINALFRRAFKYGLVSQQFNIEKLIMDRDKGLFRLAIRDKNHCLFSLFPCKSNSTYGLRNRGHNLALPQISDSLFRKSFVNRALFELK